MKSKITHMKHKAKNLLSSIQKGFFPVRWKENNELSYRKKIHEQEGVMKNDHYAYFYTGHFGLDDSFYENKVVLVIGCGPRGSLE